MPDNLKNCFTFRADNWSDESIDEILAYLICEFGKKGHTASKIKSGHGCKYFIIEYMEASIAVVLFSKRVSPEKCSIFCYNHKSNSWWKRFFDKSLRKFDFSGDELAEICDQIYKILNDSQDYCDIKAMSYFQWKQWQMEEML